jgi:Ca2+-binding RTX toxin-like protein
MAKIVGKTALDMGNWDNQFNESSGADIGEHDESHFIATTAEHTFSAEGEGFEYEEIDDDIFPTDGTVHSFSVSDTTGLNFTITRMSDDATDIALYVASEDWDGFAVDVFSGKDTIVGSRHDDLVRGFDGADRISGGRGNDILSGDDGGDTLRGGSGDDRFYYNERIDTITDFTTADDVFGLTLAVDEVEDPITGGTLRQNHFDSDLAAQIGSGELGLGGAVLFGVSDGGRYDGHTFLVINFNSQAGYQASLDLVIDVTGISGALDTDNFITV